MGVIPRIFYGNVLNCHALLRAYRVYFSTPKQKHAPRQPAWDKTDHDFPGRHPLLDYRQSFSQLLLSQHLLSTAQLHAARQRCYQTGVRLGEALCSLGYLDASQVVHVLARQYDLTLVNRADCMAAHDLPRGVLVILRRMLRQGQLAVVSLDVVNMKITLAIKDPTHVLLINHCIARLEPVKS